MGTSPWPQRAELLQEGLERNFGALLRPFRNWHPAGWGDWKSLNYWWLAHAIEARLDAYERSGSRHRLEQAERIFRFVVWRNGRSLFNDYFDDMGWLGIAALRLADLTGSARYRQAAADLWHHVHTLGWNDAAGGGIAWRKQQLAYKNTPSNGTFIILGARLYRQAGEAEYLDGATRAFDWLERTLRRPDGFIEDGINSKNDGRIDDWKFSYNQGLYMGACAELAAAADGHSDLRHSELTERAFVTERAAWAELADGGVLADRGDGGDVALFKGVWYRYAAQLALSDGAATDASERVRAHLFGGCDILWERGLRGGALLAGPDWREPASGRVPLSAQLAAVIATEACARLA
jgi:predicted alpha-1,6-mannanase (GH76 family)